MNHHKDNQTDYRPIEQYGIIGNLHTVALISLQGTIDFMCFRRFDYPTVFCSLLDNKIGGFFEIKPQMSETVYKQLYLPDTPVLLTRFLADEGIAELTDYMPVLDGEQHCAVVRKLRSVRGNITYKLCCSPAFNYARTKHKVEKFEDGIKFIPVDTNFSAIVLYGAVDLKIDNENGTAEFSLKESETAVFILADEKTLLNFSSPDDCFNKTYLSTISYWKKWISQSQYKGRWREMVNRSALTLKLLTSIQYGSLVASPTFGLPEKAGGERNWDYRFTWIRDAAFTMYVFLKLGFKKEAEDFLGWIKQRCIKGELQLMYAVDGETQLEEIDLDYMDGYKHSKPVRIGNDAHRQFQLDIYGELLDTIYLFNKHNGDITYEFWQEIAKQVEFVIDHWSKPDHGIWEIRNDKRRFAYSAIMCWVAMDRAIRIAENRSFPYPMNKWHKVRDEIFKNIYKDFWNEEKQSFVQSAGSDALDASILLMPLKKVISPYEEKWLSTMEAIDKELRLDVLVYRYRNGLEQTDGLEGGEGTFTMCSFWYIQCLAQSGQTERAIENFEKMLGYANHLGLYSEQIGVRGEHLGNFPQAYTHLSLISAALELYAAEQKTQQNSGN